MICLQRCGIGDGLVRLACGIEATADLIQDFEHALAAIGGKANALSLGSSNVEDSGLGKVSSDGLSNSPDVNPTGKIYNAKIARQV